MEKRGLVPIPAEVNVLQKLTDKLGLGQGFLPVGYWKSLHADLQTLDFSDFVVFVRDDFTEGVAHILTWCFVETRATIEKQYHHLPPERSPLTYPLVPQKMARTPFPLHPGGKRYYVEAGYLGGD
jgi:TRAP-type uncharacterized transport system substrate-binding protein